MSKSTQPAAAKPRRKPFFTNDDLWGYAFIGVAVIFFLMFTIYPLISAVITSLEDYKPFGSDFVGLKNYQTTFTNALFWKSLKNTLVYTAVVVPLSLLISFTISLDEFIIAFFLGGTQVTLPVYIFSQFRFPQSVPVIMALGTILVALSILLLSIAEYFRRRGIAKSGGKDTGGFL